MSNNSSINYLNLPFTMNDIPLICLLGLPSNRKQAETSVRAPEYLRVPVEFHFPHLWMTQQLAKYGNRLRPRSKS